MAKHRIVRVFRADCTVENGVVGSYVCRSAKCCVEIFPNFIANLLPEAINFSFTTPSQFSNSELVYFGGNNAFERQIFKQYASLLV